MAINISQKQRDFLTSGFRRINLLEGSVRSGKTWISIAGFALFVAASPPDAEFLMVGKTITTLRRNCLGLLQELEPSFAYNVSAKKAVLYGHTVWLEGATDERAESKIRGMTLAGAYVDELTLIPQSFYYMLLSRLSYKGAKLFATTNPDSPNNYVYTDIICNNDLDKRVTKFLLRDNCFLDEEYIESLEREYTGVFYQRYILGEWVLAEGLVYPMYNNTVPTKDREYSDYSISMDYGILNPTAMLLWGYCEADKKWYVIREYYHSGKATNIQKTDGEYYEDLVRLCGDYPVIEVIIDPSASSFIALIRQKGRFTVRKADNNVIAGIQRTATCLANGYIAVNDCCVNLIREFGLYSWNPKTEEDTVIKENDHALDALRYFVQTHKLYRGENKYTSIFECRKNVRKNVF